MFDEVLGCLFPRRGTTTWLAIPPLPTTPCCWSPSAGRKGRTTSCRSWKTSFAAKTCRTERLPAVAEHYDCSAASARSTPRIARCWSRWSTELNAHGPQLPVYWGNRNWHPLLAEAIEQMADDGVGRAWRSSLRRSARTPAAGNISKTSPMPGKRSARSRPADRQVSAVLQSSGLHRGDGRPRVGRAGSKCPPSGAAARLIFTAHSIPVAMANRSAYERSLREACRLVCRAVGTDRVAVGLSKPQRAADQPWLEPDVANRSARLAAGGASRDVVLAPIGFLCEHMEVVYDLDVEARRLVRGIGVEHGPRRGWWACHPRFVRMIRELILERTEPDAEPMALGTHGPAADECEPA